MHNLKLIKEGKLSNSVSSSNFTEFPLTSIDKFQIDYLILDFNFNYNQSILLPDIEYEIYLNYRLFSMNSSIVNSVYLGKFGNNTHYYDLQKIPNISTELVFLSLAFKAGTNLKTAVNLYYSIQTLTLNELQKGDLGSSNTIKTRTFPSSISFQSTKKLNQLTSLNFIFPKNIYSLYNTTKPISFDISLKLNAIVTDKDTTKLTLTANNINYVKDLFMGNQELFYNMTNLNIQYTPRYQILVYLFGFKIKINVISITILLKTAPENSLNLIANPTSMIITSGILYCSGIALTTLHGKKKLAIKEKWILK